MIPGGQPGNYRPYVPPPTSRLELALEAGFDPHPDDVKPPAAHLRVDGYTVAVLAEEIRAHRFVGELTRCSHHHCRTSLTDETAVFCPHNRAFCGGCTWEDACAACDDAAWDAEIDRKAAS